MKGGIVVFYQKLIDLNISVETEEQLFDLVGSRAIKLDFARIGYISNLEKRELSYPTGLKFPQVSLALPHVDPQYVENPFIYIGRTIKPLKLKQMGDDADMEAKDFLFLGLKNGSKQPELLAQIISAFQDKDFVKHYMETENTKDMLQIVKNKFKEVIK